MSSVSGEYESTGMKYLRYMLIYGLLSIVLFPILWIILSSIKPSSTIFTTPPQILPESPTLVHYQEVIRGPMGDYFLNSVIVTVVSVITSVALSVMAGYGWAKFEFRGSRITSTIVILSRVFPIVVILVPLFQILKTLGIINSHVGVVVSYYVYTLPLTSWMLKGFFENIPDNVIRAARIDGFSELQIFTRVVLPMIRPGIIATALLTVTIAWQELLFSLTFLQDDGLYTMPVGLLELTNQFNTQWGLMMASSFLFMLPVAVLFITAQNYFIEGITGGEGGTV
jgi:ABC-type glycerol-3-phosphate transport system permease component